MLFEPALLLSATQLSRLSLDSVGVDGDGYDLLSAVLKLKQLVVLRLDIVTVEWPQHPAALYEALTASSMLRELFVSADLPSCAWSRAFPPSRLMHQLRSFTYHHYVVSTDNASGPPMSAEDVCSVVRCCPGLTQLSLCITGSDGVAAAIKSIATLTTLRDLSLTMPPGEHGIHRLPSALLPLTALRPLTSCKVGDELWCDDDSDDGDEVRRNWGNSTRRCQQHALSLQTACNSRCCCVRHPPPALDLLVASI